MFSNYMYEISSFYTCIQNLILIKYYHTLINIIYDKVNLFYKIYCIFPVLDKHMIQVSQLHFKML